jgi:hypothetical protein
LAPNNGLQVLCWQHPQAGCEKDHFTSKDTELALATLLGACPAGEANNTDYVTSLDVLVLLLEGRVGLGLLQLAHDLNRGAFCLA